MRKAAIILLFISFLSGCVTKNTPSPITSEEFIVIAHRGASTYAPEHTMISYQLAKEFDATYIEIDLQMTKDGVLVAMHDEKVDRTTNGTGLVKDYTLKEIKQLNAGNWFNKAHPTFASEIYEYVPVPTLEEIFEEFGQEANYYIELKSPKLYEGMEEELQRLLKEFDLIQTANDIPKVIIQSFDRASLQEMHQLEPKLPLIQLLSLKEKGKLSRQDFSTVKKYASGIGVNINMVDQTFIHEAQERGLPVHLFSVKTEADMRHAIEMKANGIFTDSPNIAREIIERY